MKKLLLLFIVISIFLYGCSYSEPNQGDASLNNMVDKSQDDMTDEEFANYILSEEHLDETIGLLYYYGNEQQMKRDYYIKERSRIDAKAWNSPSMRYLLRHHQWWYEPRVYEILDIKVGKNRNVITGVFRMTMVPATSVIDKPAFLEFEVTKKSNGWMFSNFGKLQIKNSYYLKPPEDFRSTSEILIPTGNKVTYDEDLGDEGISLKNVSVTIDNGFVPTEEMTPEEYVWYVMFYDNISDFGLGLGNKLVEALVTNNPRNLLSTQAKKSPSWRYLIKNNELWRNPLFSSIEEFELISRNKIKGIMKLYLINTNFWEKEGRLEFTLEKTKNGWQYTDFGMLKIPKVNYNSKIPPEKNIEVYIKN